MDDYLLGIDFGSCSIKVARFDPRRGDVRSLKIDKSDSNTDNRILNIIQYRSRDEYFVGDVARKGQISDPLSAVTHIKRKLEYKDWCHTFPGLGFTLTAEEIVQDILSWIRKRVREDKGHGIEEAVLTVPVCFSQEQKQKLVSAARKAGIPLRAVLTEPVASLFSIEGLFEDACEEYVVVFDFGGSTLDICLSHIENHGDGTVDINVLSSVGVNYGGLDVTETIAKQVLSHKYQGLLEEEKAKSSPELVEAALLEIAEELKVQLFNGDEDEQVEEAFLSPYNKIPLLDMQLGSAEVIELLERTGVKELVLRSLDELFEDVDECTKEDVTLVRMLGGSSRITYFRELLADYFGKEACDLASYDEGEVCDAVARGAANYLKTLRAGEDDIQLNESIPYFIGMDRQGRFHELIKKNQVYGTTPFRSIPARELESMGWTITLYQAFSRERTNFDGENGAVYLGAFSLDRTRYEGTENVLYKFRVDPSGKMTGMFYITDDENEPVLVEEKEFMCGG